MQQVASISTFTPTEKSILQIPHCEEAKKGVCSQDSSIVNIPLLLYCNNDMWMNAKTCDPAPIFWAEVKTWGCFLNPDRSQSLPGKASGAKFVFKF